MLWQFCSVIWLAKNQKEDSSWDTDYGKTCGVAGLGLLAFLEADETWRNVSIKVILKVHAKEGYYAR